MTELGLKQKDLVPLFKTESIVSSILSGQRKFTVEHIEKLAEFFKVSPSVFFKRSRLAGEGFAAEFGGGATVLP